MPLAPWLPPMTSSVVQVLAQAEFLRARRSARSRCEIRADRRAGNFRSRLGKNCAHSSKPSSTARTIRAVSLFALPGMAFDSWTKVGISRICPARIGAVEVKPPMPSTACGLNFAINRRGRPSGFLQTGAKNAENRRGKRRRQPDRGQFLDTEICPARHGERVDLLFRNEEHDFMAAGAQDLRDREPREQMPAGAASMRSRCS